uniref:DPH4 n=1 Tax=Ceratitis capitata TaxID=7213 RepID=W8BS92_CERCA
MSMKNYYEILQSTPTASFEELRRNYKQLILQCHPDKLQHDTNITKDPNTNADTAINVAASTINPNARNVASLDELNGEFVAINEAWNTLKDATKRKLYDAELLLSKFQTHSNIFAHVTLADMKRCTDTTTTSDGSKTGSGNDNDSGDEGRVKSGVEDDIYWYYTYDCRCGGQYIVDESLDSEIINRNHKHVAHIHSDKQTSEEHEIYQQKQINCDKYFDKNSQASADSKNCQGNAFASSSGSFGSIGGDGGVSKDSQSSAKANDDDDGEVLVECSECSLVIVLT